MVSSIAGLVKCQLRRPRSGFRWEDNLVVDPQSVTSPFDQIGPLLVAEGGDRFESAPLPSGTPLHRVFAELQPTKEGLLDFANRYGLLTGGYPPIEGYEFLAESYGRWTFEWLEMRLLVRLWDGVRRGGLGEFVRWADTRTQEGAHLLDVIAGLQAAPGMVQHVVLLLLTALLKEGLDAESSLLATKLRAVMDRRMGAAVVQEDAGQVVDLRLALIPQGGSPPWWGKELAPVIKEELAADHERLAQMMKTNLRKRMGPWYPALTCELIGLLENLRRGGELRVARKLAEVLKQVLGRTHGVRSDRTTWVLMRHLSPEDMEFIHEAEDTLKQQLEPFPYVYVDKLDIVPLDCREQVGVIYRRAGVPTGEIIFQYGYDPRLHGEWQDNPLRLEVPTRWFIGQKLNSRLRGEERYLARQPEGTIMGHPSGRTSLQVAVGPLEDWVVHADTLLVGMYTQLCLEILGREEWAACAVCGKWFPRTRSDRIYCGDPCKVRAYRRRSRRRCAQQEEGRTKLIVSGREAAEPELVDD